jgi:hypothetical protein
MKGQRRLDIFPGEVFCRRCGRKLKTKKARAVGYGAGCVRFLHERRAGSAQISKLIDEYTERERHE